jgi:hypothetical protein
MKCADPGPTVAGGSLLWHGGRSTASQVRIVEIAVSLDWIEVWDAN